MLPKSDMEAKAEKVRELIKSKNIQFCDMKFTDLFGLWQHTTIPISYVDQDFWDNGHGFDGSSIRGFQAIQESDMLLIPDTDTAILDPFCEIPTLSVVCDIVDPLSRKPYSRDPRYIAKKAEKFLKDSGLGDISYWGPEMEFFLFSHAAFDQNMNSGFYFLDSPEALWNAGAKDDKHNLANKIKNKEGYFPVAPHDTLMDIRSEMVAKMIEAGIDVETHHHEVATAGQNEIDMKYNTLVSMADQSLLYKYIVKNVAKAHNLVATFMPKPLFGDNGSGMHTHQSIWKNGENTFFDKDGYAMLSQTAKYYIGGILKHAESLMAFCAPTTNSYKRLVPGFEAPVNLTYSARNRSAAIRIPMYSANPKSKRIEFRSPDATANPYIAFAAMLMAGLDGIMNRIDPGEPFEENTYESQKAKTLRTVPRSLEASLNALENDNMYLLKGEVFTPDVIDAFINFKRDKEIDPLRLRPHPHEFSMYFDA